MRVLLVSNGYGEDLMGAVLGRALRDRGAEVAAYPLVGTGHAYAAEAIPTLDPRRTLPTAGFGFRTGVRAAWQDLRAGWLSLTVAQRRTLRAQRGRCDLVVAVGDVFCLWMASAAGPRGVVYVPTAKSEYNDPHRLFELALVRRLARLSFPRDQLTTDRFRGAGLAAEFVGNLMMDCLEFSGDTFDLPPDVPTILLLPGSRSDAPHNFASLCRTAQAVACQRPEVCFLVALSPTVDVAALARASGATVDGQWLGFPGMRVRWTRKFADALARAWVVVGMAGTAHEQAAGLGKPVVAYPGGGVQFTAKFLHMQARLLSDALVPVRAPEQAAEWVLRLIDDPEERRRRGRVGQERMGPPGAASRMADRLLARGGR
ncbi:MAG: lipid-A-disaccharide synthase-related protein [Armatimonadota bacterium]|nr:lipid-A-disaccharide synthase-related protein [Armatimonadota bacterium]MDW8155864.1 lipid-A-disaccharide synthase-related protein [Armatimonadota bacterium]